MLAPSHAHGDAPPLDSHLWIPLAVTFAASLGETLVALLVLHGAVGRAMRARGMAWRLRDSALVSPLLLVGLFVFFGALNHGLLRYALAMAHGARETTDVAAAAVVAGGGLTIAWFGARAVGKLY